MTHSVRMRTARMLRGGAWIAGRAGSRLRRFRIRCLYPNVTFVGDCFLDKGVRIIAVRDARVTVRACHLSRSVTIEAGADATIDIGADFIGPGSIVVAQASVIVGSGSKLAEMVVVRDADHDHSRPLSDMAFVTDPVVIGADVWIGAGATVLKGVRVGDGATVAAGAVVTRDVAPGTAVGGIPSRDLHRGT